jgi:hypothetical protein
MTDPVIEALRTKAVRRAALTRLVAGIPAEPDGHRAQRGPDDEPGDEGDREEPRTLAA